MALIRNFLSDSRGNVVGRFGLLAGAVALCSIAGTHYLNVATRDGGGALLAMFRPGHSQPLDYTPTATIQKQAGQTALDPCTGKPK